MRKEPKDRYHCFLYEDIVGKMRMAQVLFIKKEKKNKAKWGVFILTQIRVLEFTSYKGEAVTSSWKYLRLLRESHSWEILGANMLEGFESNFHFFRVLKNLKGFLKEIHKTDSIWELNFLCFKLKVFKREFSVSLLFLLTPVLKLVRQNERQFWNEVLLSSWELSSSILCKFSPRQEKLVNNVEPSRETCHEKIMENGYWCWSDSVKKLWKNRYLVPQRASSSLSYHATSKTLGTTAFKQLNIQMFKK